MQDTTGTMILAAYQSLLHSTRMNLSPWETFNVSLASKSKKLQMVSICRGPRVIVTQKYGTFSDHFKQVSIFTGEPFRYWQGLRLILAPNFPKIMVKAVIAMGNFGFGWWIADDNHLGTRLFILTSNTPTAKYVLSFEIAPDSNIVGKSSFFSFLGFKF